MVREVYNTFFGEKKSVFPAGFPAFFYIWYPDVNGYKKGWISGASPRKIIFSYKLNLTCLIRVGSGSGSAQNLGSGSAQNLGSRSAQNLESGSAQI